MAEDVHITEDVPRSVQLDGILDGRIADGQALVEASSRLSVLGIGNFELERDGGRYSLMPDGERHSGAGFGTEQQARLLAILQQVARATHGTVESTLRCTMVFEHGVSETLFRGALGADGQPTVEAVSRLRERRVGDVPTEAAPPPPWRGLLQRREIVVALPLLVLGVLLMAWTSGLLDRLLSAGAGGLQKDTGAFGELLTLEASSSWGDYAVEVRRGPGHPAGTEAWDQLLATAPDESARARIQVVREGNDVYVRLEDGDGRFAGERLVSLRALVTRPDGVVKVRVPGRITAARITMAMESGKKQQ